MDSRTSSSSVERVTTLVRGSSDNTSMSAENTFRNLSIDGTDKYRAAPAQETVGRHSIAASATNNGGVQMQASAEGTAPFESSLADEITKDEYQVFIIGENTGLPYRILDVLGVGASAYVSKVQDTRSGRIYARKTMTFNTPRVRARREEDFNNEVGIMRSLKDHHHMIQIVAGIIGESEFGLIMQPAASGGNLESYLTKYGSIRKQAGTAQKDSEAISYVLERAFGCLASGLAYIHAQGFRHKDIKPSNILVHDGSVLYTDFGSSKDAKLPGESTTDGLATDMTKKYAAPEVLLHAKRNYSSDTYSLGCVYVNLLTALVPSFSHDEDMLFSEMMNDLHANLAATTFPPRWSFISSIITAMTMRDRKVRPKMDRVYHDIAEHDGFSCLDCRRTRTPKPTYTPWKWDAEQRRHYCHLIDEDGRAVGHVWSASAGESSPPSVTVYSPSAARSGQSSTDTRLLQVKPTFGSEKLLSLVQSSSQGNLDTDDTDLLESRYRRVAASSYPDFFIPGRVFKMLWKESEGGPELSKSKSRASSHYSIESTGPGSYAEIRRFVVIENKETFSRCIAIQTHKIRGISGQSGPIVEDHGVIHTSTMPPAHLAGENIVTKNPIRVAPMCSETLQAESRVNYRKKYAVEHNVKIVEIGLVVKEHIHMLLAYSGVKYGSIGVSLAL